MCEKKTTNYLIREPILLPREGKVEERCQKVKLFVLTRTNIELVSNRSKCKKIQFKIHFYNSEVISFVYITNKNSTLWVLFETFKTFFGLIFSDLARNVLLTIICLYVSDNFFVTSYEKTLSSIGNFSYSNELHPERDNFGFVQYKKAQKWPF